jgi:hypothetical protein
MAKKSGWELLQAGDFRGALRLLKEEHKKDPYIGSLVNLGVAHLCLGNAQSAKKILDEALLDPSPDTGTHALAGIARWTSGERADALRTWVKGLDCDYRDEAGGMELPLLLFYASARDPHIFPKARANKLIKEALESSLATNWPGPLGRFVLGQIDEKQARSDAEFEHPDVTSRQLNQVEFYAGLLAYIRGDKDEFIDRMRRCALTRRCELNNEWHLARFEVAKEGKGDGVRKEKGTE